MLKINLTFRLFCDIIYRQRGVAQLVERVLWEHQAVGSNPATPTKKNPRVSEVFSMKSPFGLMKV